MSTRSNIFVDFNGERKQFYHHCDGYFAGVGKDLLARMEIAIARARNANGFKPLLMEQLRLSFLKSRFQMVAFY